MISGAGFWQAGLALGCLKSGGHSATPGFVPPRCGSAVLRRDSVKTAVFRIPNGGRFSGDFLELIVGTISLRTGPRFDTFHHVWGSLWGASCRDNQLQNDQNCPKTANFPLKRSVRTRCGLGAELFQGQNARCGLGAELFQGQNARCGLGADWGVPVAFVFQCSASLFPELFLAGVHQKRLIVP